MVRRRDANTLSPTLPPGGREQHAFAARLVAWQRAHGRHALPWQNTRDPYRIWLSEIMLQQTQVATVLGYYDRFLTSFPTVQSLAAASDDAVMAHWAGLGYYSRARNLHKAAKQIVEMHGGEFPQSVEALADLPGIGRSTAAAIAAFAFDVIAPILDGNVKRVVARHAGIEGFPGASAVEKQLWSAAESRLPLRSTDMVAYTQGIMDLGASLCAKSNPRCDQCPIAADCVARLSARIDEIPAAKPSKKIPHRSQRYLLATHGEAVLLVKRPPTGIWGGLWCLPELHAEMGDSEVSALVSVQFAIKKHGSIEPAAELEHGFTHFKLTLQPIRMTAIALDSRAAEPGAMWLPLADIANAALPKPISTILRRLLD
ncbi:MAG: A/G-specific adenine glycosylase [Betaproteobacteria bacterium]|nr:MAG: A/G-specific adenine glycosylase [Betaproteobacteria bacterium]